MDPDELAAATDALKQLAREQGADAVGVASVDAIDERAPDGYGIRDILHDAATVVVAGVDESTAGAKASGSSMVLWDSKISRRGLRGRIRMALNDRIEHGYGYESLRFPKAFKEGGMIPYGSLKVAAEEAGLGRRGVNDLVLHPEHGAHLGFTAVITNMPLVPDEPLAENPCPTPFCENAFEHAGITPCMAACPVDALDGELEAGEIRSRSYDRAKCMSCSMNTGAQRFARELAEVLDEDDPERRRHRLFGDDFQRTVTSMIRGTGWANCFECQTVCPVGSEAARRAMADGGEVDAPTVDDVLAVRAAALAEREPTPHHRSASESVGPGDGHDGGRGDSTGTDGGAA